MGYSCAIPLAILPLLLSSCGARVSVRQYGGNEPVYSGKVCMMETPPPPMVNYQMIGTIESYMHTYGSTEAVLEAMADEARKWGQLQ